MHGSMDHRRNLLRWCFAVSAALHLALVVMAAGWTERLVSDQPRYSVIHVRLQEQTAAQNPTPPQPAAAEPRVRSVLSDQRADSRTSKKPPRTAAAVMHQELPSPAAEPAAEPVFRNTLEVNGRPDSLPIRPQEVKPARPQANDTLSAPLQPRRVEPLTAALANHSVLDQAFVRRPHEQLEQIRDLGENPLSPAEMTGQLSSSYPSSVDGWDSPRYQRAQPAGAITGSISSVRTAAWPEENEAHFGKPEKTLPVRHGSLQSLTAVRGTAHGDAVQKNFQASAQADQPLPDGPNKEQQGPPNIKAASLALGQKAYPNRTEDAVVARSASADRFTNIAAPVAPTAGAVPTHGLIIRMSTEEEEEARTRQADVFSSRPAQPQRKGVKGPVSSFSAGSIMRTSQIQREDAQEHGSLKVPTTVMLCEHRQEQTVVENKRQAEHDRPFRQSERLMSPSAEERVFEPVSAARTGPSSPVLPAVPLPAVLKVDPPAKVNHPLSAAESTPKREVSGNEEGSGSQTAEGPNWSVVRQVKPVYPSAARRRGLEGTVVLSVQVDQNGVPVDVQVASSSGRMDFDLAASQAVSQWQFKLKNGTAPEPQRLTVKVEFRLTQEE